MHASEVQSDDPVIAKDLKAFRDQLVALGALWIIIGRLSGAFGIYMSTASKPEGALGIVQLVINVINIGYGVASFTREALACMKRIAALRVGLVLIYVILVLQVLSVNLCRAAIMVVAILQAHRVLGFRKKLMAAGAMPA